MFHLLASGLSCFARGVQSLELEGRDLVVGVRRSVNPHRGKYGTTMKGSNFF